MPRKPRIDIPGVYQHVMARGIDGIKIYRNRADYQAFIKILSFVRESSSKDTGIMAWALMPNHFHLLLFIGKTPLSTIMRRLMTGYAVYFNRKHRRKGHLFQNRYKSIVCQEDEYLLQLVRYIHLNPLKAKIVKTLKDLDHYDYTGHKTLMGHLDYTWQDTQPVLRYFDNSPQEYRNFIKDGIDASDEFFLDSVSTDSTLKTESKELQSSRQSYLEDKKVFDERILGGEDFVEKVLDQLENNYDSYTQKKPISEIIESALNKHRISKDHLILKTSKIVRIRRDIIEECVFKHHYQASVVSDALNMHRSSVAKIIRSRLSDS